MSDYGDYRVTVFDRHGYPLSELDVPFHCVWAANEHGPAEMRMSARYDPKCRDDLVWFGNLVLFEHQRLPSWGGVIVPHDRMDGTGDGEIIIRMRSGEFQFARRRAPMWNRSDLMLNLNAPAGETFRRLIGYANEVEDTRLRAGVIDDFSRKAGVQLRERMLNELLEKVLNKVNKRSDADFWVEPGRDEHNLLVLYANLIYQRDTDSEYELQEDINLETPSGTFWSLGGELANDVSILNQSEEDGPLLRRGAYDETSRDKNGLWQWSDVVSTDAPVVLQNTADQVLAERGEPLYRFILVAIETPESPNTFAFLRVGKKVHIVLHSVGLRYGQYGIDKRARILAMEYDTEEKRCIVTVEEVR